MTKVVSKARSLNAKAMEAWCINFLKFSTPTFAIFFSLLAQGVPLEKAWPVAVFGFYQSLSDLFNKWSKEIRE
jgi:hypothetical protein